MSLKVRLMEDMKSALKNNDTLRRSTITMVRAAILQKEKDERKELNDDDIIGVISREVKQRRDAIPEFEKGNRPDLVDKLNSEINILMEYLPQQLTENEVDAMVLEAISEVNASGIKDMGKVMGVLMPRLKGRADGKLVNQLVRKHLQ
ncbi:MAG TPA: GatB/YqeY domain-containing protein [Clostridiales bacterium]|nr:GatB/YqeY domain-containing protein [Clostridiales bacterium]